MNVKRRVKKTGFVEPAAGFILILATTLWEPTRSLEP
jgi:hypothetical protein